MKERMGERILVGTIMAVLAAWLSMETSHRMKQEERLLEAERWRGQITQQVEGMSDDMRDIRAWVIMNNPREVR